MVCGEMLRAAVVEIVAIDRGDDDMGQAELRDRLGDILGLAGVERAGMPVLTLQKAQARVQVSPMIMKVACFLSQHSPMLGQPASSQTVTRPCSRTISRVSHSRASPARLHPDPVRLGGDDASGRLTFSGCRGRTGSAETVSRMTTME